MAQSYWPFDGIDTTETQYSQLFRRLKMSGVWGQPSDTALKPYGDSSGLFVKFAAGYAFVRGHMYYTDAVVSVAVTAGSAGARVDLLVLRLDPAANTITPVVIAGTSGSPTPPNPVQTDAANYDLVLGTIAVPASAATITAGNVTDGRFYAGHDFGLWTTATRPTAGSFPPVRIGQPGFNTTTGKPEFYTGAGWSGFTPSTVDPTTLSAAVPINKGGTGSTTAVAALAALGAAAVSHDHDGADITTGTVPGARLPAATTTLAGISEIATMAEVITGTDDVRSISPKALKDYMSNAAFDSLVTAMIADSYVARGTGAVEIRVTNTAMTAGTATGTLRFW